MTGDRRRVLRLDAAACVALGVLAAGPARAVADDLGTVHVGLVRALGAFLLAYAVALAVLAAGSPATVRLATASSAVADAGWVLASAALVAEGAFSTGGAAAVAVVAVGVAGLGLAKAATFAGRRAAAAA